jgi:CubicO group peptidase (beta-lactamase class C family)
MQEIRKFTFCLFITALSSLKLFPQPLPDSIIKKIDVLFKKWDNNFSPGCVIGIVRNDSLIYAKGYGMANLENNVAITAETIFHMASVSKQFTAYSIVLLARQNKLRLDDDIHKYLPWFPDLKEKITIRNLLNHTSGIRDQWQLLNIAGIRPNDVITQDQLIRILSSQQALNFKPGKEYSYSNSNFTLAAEIIKSITGQSLRKFTDSAIFKPLGMTRTHFRDDLGEIESRATSYNRLDNTHFSNSIWSNSAVGATNLYTNVPDMSKWLVNFYYSKAGDRRDIDSLTKKSKLNNGKELDYALGILSGNYRGWKEFSHAGGDAGYRSYINVFPDLKMGFMVFSNIPEVGTFAKAHAIADLFISDAKTSDDRQKIDSTKIILNDDTQIRKYLGDYIYEEGQQIHLSMKGKKLYLSSDAFGDSIVLLKEKENTFLLTDGSAIKITLTADSKGRPTVTLVFPEEDEKYVFTSYNKDETIPDDILKNYTGVYYSPELEYRYTIFLKDHHLFIRSLRYNETAITFAGPDHLYTGMFWINHLMILRANNKITGFEVNSGRVRHLRFNKIE